MPKTAFLYHFLFLFMTVKSRSTFTH